jgi:hypothetical protein
MGFAMWCSSHVEVSSQVSAADRRHASSDRDEWRGRYAEEVSAQRLRAIGMTTAAVILGVILAHGLAAAPLAERYARWCEQHPRDQALPMGSAHAEVTRPRGPLEQLDTGATARRCGIS